MIVPVLDASLFVSSISPNEVLHGVARAALAQFSPATPFVVPELFRVEVIAALARRREPDSFIDSVVAYLSTERFLIIPMDAALADRAVEIARSTRLRAYDSVYVALSLTRSAPLLTLDAEVADRVRASFPGARVIPGDT
jgi:predicted nucleic acid-binding protein